MFGDCCQAQPMDFAVWEGFFTVSMLRSSAVAHQAKVPSSANILT